MCEISVLIENKMTVHDVDFVMGHIVFAGCVVVILGKAKSTVIN